MTDHLSMIGDHHLVTVGKNMADPPDPSVNRHLSGLSLCTDGKRIFLIGIARSLYKLIRNEIGSLIECLWRISFSSSVRNVETVISFALSKSASASSICIVAAPRRRYRGAPARKQIMLCSRENNLTPAIPVASFTRIVCRLFIDPRTVVLCSFSFSRVSRPGTFDLTSAISSTHFSISSGTP